MADERLILPIDPACPWLAPLAGYTDLMFRTLCREQGAAAACTEMVSAKGLIYGERGRKGHNATRELLRTEESDSPLVVQLFGAEPEFLGQAVELLRSWGFGWFDLNLGCSVPKVTKSGAGAALAKDMQKTLAAAEAMIKAAGAAPALPGGVAALTGRVGFKLRLGWSPEEENYLELARGLEQCGAAWLTLHPRYARQGFAGNADSAALETLVRTVGIPVIASGDLLDARAALRVVRQTGVSGVMFARGALHNPAIFKDYVLLLEQGSGNGGGKDEEAGLRPDPEVLKTLLLRHAQLAQSTGQDAERAVLKMRGALPRYVKNLPGSKAFRAALSRCASWTEFYKLLEDFFGGHYAGD